MLQGLKYLHSREVARRDIKGANLLTTKDATVKLADFGVAMKLRESTKSMSIVGRRIGWLRSSFVGMRTTPRQDACLIADS